MPYDPKLDETSFSKSWESDTERLTVAVHSYNQGQKKLQISRENKDAEGEFRFARLGRLTKKELESLMPLFQEALKHMD